MAVAPPVSVGANGEHAQGVTPLPALGAWAVSAVPAVALAAALHLLIVIARAGVSTARTSEPARPSPPERNPLASPARLPARAEVRRLLKRPGPQLDPATVARRTGVS